MADSPTNSPKEWAVLLKRNWEDRAQSSSRDFYVASHPGWNDPEIWARQAETDTGLFLHSLEADWLAPAHVLEIGCGVGRLAGPLRSHCASYTGFDIAESMVAEARRRHDGADGVRFLVGDGLGVPGEAADRAYRLALAAAVFIHCPREVIASLVQSAYALLEPGGELRFQLRADPEDGEGIQGAPDVAAQQAGLVEHESRVRMMETSASAENMSLIDGRYYMGHMFRYADASPFLADITGGDVTVLRFDPAHLYGWVRKT